MPIEQLNANGTIDTGFKGTGLVSNEIGAINIQNDGKILLGGQKPTRLNTDGSRDSGFNMSGSVLRGGAGYGQSIIAEPDGKILLGGYFTTHSNNYVGYFLVLHDRGLKSYLVNNSYNNVTGTYVGNTGIDFSLIKTKIGIPLLEDISVKITSPSNANYSVKFQTGTKFLDASAQDYTGTLAPPSSLSTGTISNIPSGATPLSAIRIGSGTDIYLVNTGGVALPATVSVPVSASLNGQTVKVYYSNNLGSTWNNLTSTVVAGGLATFQTTHFTDFVVAGGGTGTFVINNDETNTSSLDVSLNITMPISVSGMRFSNDGSSRSSWETYSNTGSWTLLPGDGEKIVYAQFDYNGDTISDLQTYDVIIYTAIVQNAGCQGTGAENTCLVLELTPGMITRGAPISGLDFGMVGVNNTGISLSGTFVGNDMLLNYFRVEDMIGSNSGWYTYVQSSNLTGSITGTSISASLVSIYSDTGLRLFNGNTNNTYSLVTGSDIPLDGPVTYLQRNIGNNTGIISLYGHQPWIKVAIPPFQTPGAYRGRLVFTLYER